jgi:hypothetical protein
MAGLLSYPSNCSESFQRTAGLADTASPCESQGDLAIESSIRSLTCPPEPVQFTW